MIALAVAVAIAAAEVLAIVTTKIVVAGKP